jgi:hypothetical protein
MCQYCRWQMCTTFWLENLNGRDHFGYYESREMITICLWILREKVWTKLKWLRLRSNGGAFLNTAIKPRESIKAGNILIGLATIKLLRKVQIHGVNYILIPVGLRVSSTLRESKPIISQSDEENSYLSIRTGLLWAYKWTVPSIFMVNGLVVCCTPRQTT